MQLKMNRLVWETMVLSQQLLELAGTCEAVARTDGALMFCAELRECGYRLRRAAIDQRLRRGTEAGRGKSASRGAR